TDLDNWSGADALGVAAGGLTSASLALRGAALAGTPARAFASGFAADAATSAGVDALGGNATSGQVVTNALLSGAMGGAPIGAARSRLSPLWRHWSRDKRYIPPSDADWAKVPQALPRHSAPAEFSPWVNAGGHVVPGRDVNCADCARAVEVTWRGTPQVSAARAPGAGGETRAEIEAWLGRPLEPQTFKSLGADLATRGHGSSAYVVVHWKGGGGHAFNAVNHEGKVYFVDAQPKGGAVDLWPPKADSPGYGFTEADVAATYATFFPAGGGG
ncbi:MAG: hypothetical protein KY458_10440, partial [Actinobacteria bacterium]|nr:hypothetical protein [Actinomycetota bacterium]